MTNTVLRQMKLSLKGNLSTKPKPKSRVENVESNEMIQRNTYKGQWGIISDETEGKIDQN